MTGEVGSIHEIIPGVRKSFGLSETVDWDKCMMWFSAYNLIHSDRK